MPELQPHLGVACGVEELLGGVCLGAAGVAVAAAALGLLVLPFLPRFEDAGSVVFEELWRFLFFFRSLFGVAGLCPFRKLELVVFFLSGRARRALLSLVVVFVVVGLRCRCRGSFIDFRSRLALGGSCGSKLLLEVLCVLRAAWRLGVLSGKGLVFELVACCCVCSGVGLVGDQLGLFLFLGTDVRSCVIFYE